MKDSYLEITYRHGRPLAAYLYLPRRPDDTSHHCSPRGDGLVIDHAADGRPIGLEITAPERVSVDVINRVLRELQLGPLTPADLAPLRAA